MSTLTVSSGMASMAVVIKERAAANARPIGTLKQLTREVKSAAAEAVSESETPQSQSTTSFAATQEAVSVRIQAINASTFQRTVPISAAVNGLVSPNFGSTSATQDNSGFLASFASSDPKLGKDIESLLNMMEGQNPEAAARMRKVLGQFFSSLNGGQANGQTPSAQSTSGQQITEALSERQQFNMAIESTVTNLKAQMDDGVTITAEQVHATFEMSLRQIQGKGDPLVLDLNGNGRFDVTAAEDGHDFDIKANGQKVRVATTTDGDGLLAYDRNSNGIIDDGGELFGDQHGAVHGFAELAKYDDNQDNVIDDHDAIFDQLRVFQDKNKNGATDVGELHKLADFNIAALNLDAKKTDEVVNGNEVVLGADFTRTDGSTGRLGDMNFNYLA